MKLIEKFEKLAKKLSGVRDTPAFNPEKLNDPVALQTKWAPARNGGANFCTHKLKRNRMHDEKIEFKASMGMVLFCSLFSIIGIALAVGFSVHLVNTKPFVPSTLIPVIIGTVFAVAGILMMYFMTKPRVFDKNSGYFWIGHKSPREMDPRTIDKKMTRLEDIHALQLISERCTNKNGSYFSYELNLVLKDGSRVNVIDHGSEKVIRADAQTLAEFLEVPLWDAI